MGNLLMFDSISPGALPAGYDAYAGYVGGNWPDFAAEVARFPNAEVFSIAVNASEDADFLDVEAGDATNADAPGWYSRQKARGVSRPGFYTSVANAQALLDVLAAAGINRSMIRLWTAHYNYTDHICSPACGFGFTATADGTQWTDLAQGGTCDESTITPSFSDNPAPIGGDVPAPTDVVDTYAIHGTDGNTYFDLHADGGLFAYGGAVPTELEYIATANDGNRYHFGPSVTPGVFCYPGLPAADRQGTRYFVAMTVLSYNGKNIGDE